MGEVERHTYRSCYLPLLQGWAKGTNMEQKRETKQQNILPPPGRNNVPEFSQVLFASSSALLRWVPATQCQAPSRARLALPQPGQKEQKTTLGIAAQQWYASNNIVGVHRPEVAAIHISCHLRLMRKGPCLRTESRQALLS